LRQLQIELGQLGLSSLGRSEGYVRDNLYAVRRRVKNALGIVTENFISENPTGDLNSWALAESLLHANTRSIFGIKPSDRHVYIMVTAPDPVIASDGWFNELQESGMNLLRINGAHGTETDWEILARRAKASSTRTGRPLRVLVDLPGPKLRTIVRGPGVRVLKLKPERDVLGRVIAPGRVHLNISGDSFSSDPKMNIPPDIFALLTVADRLVFTDTRGRHREINITTLSPKLATGELTQTSYVGEQTEIRLVSENGKLKGTFVCSDLPFVPAEVRIPVGNTFVMYRNLNESVETEEPAIGCTLPEVFTGVRCGDRILFDDGKIQGRVFGVSEGRLEIRIEHAKKSIVVIRSDMGLNLPDTIFDIPALTSRDLEILKFAENYADIVGLSFVRSVHDIRDLESHIKRTDLGIVIKIENRQGFEALPSILVETLSRRPMAVMIARGDLAVELGFDRLAEVQEEILWLCEAAHVPVIWATQVLESLAKSGLPTRAEISDAAMAVQAECVMLNKGPYISEAVTVLSSILRRMETHQYKKRQLYRPLKVSFLDE
jgi:pyruvate kinase